MGGRLGGWRVIRGAKVVSDGIREAMEEKSQKQGIGSCCLVPEREHLSHHGRRAAVAEVLVIKQCIGHLPFHFTE